ncbi:L-threonylcarbamoyladenylate synthase [Alishewanella sp. SMS8]|uniref:L-threonylcarbamoyladenylate synthase n=1 Tax=unclassified Alishewanella TaxID=2628974 RepID=UPI0027416B20|nr:L-threonylcarbamoyladenylate synthase [Alishewanella sp. SMS8]MDP5207820.1 L-threonylcarbamoyladenylate synthase [Alishewanella sp. SMS9]MDP5459154.1 L-threonylcarbamoyladenylate synthase [Alishewanella sp. SMS8]
MNTLRLNAQQGQDIATAADLLQQGKLVAVPTETVYGLAADASNPSAVAGIFTAKGRPANHPLIVHLHAKTALGEWAKDIPAAAWQLAEAFWPGPLTLLLPKADHVSPVITGGLNSIGLRMPAHPALLQVLQLNQLAVAAPSANRYKKLSPTSAEQVLAGLNGRIDAVLDGGECEHGVESTIVDLTGEQIRIVRAGPITASQLQAVLKTTVLQPQQHQMQVPGNVDAHYQPNTPLRCLDSAQLHALLLEQPSNIAVLHLNALPTAQAGIICKQMPTDAAGYASQLYRQLYQADKLGVSAIWCELPPQGEAWLAVHDRLRRAQFIERS